MWNLCDTAHKIQLSDFVLVYLMTKTSREGWTQVSIPKEMHDRIKELINDDYLKGVYAFGSISEFVRRGLSKYIKDLEEELRSL